MEGLRQRRRAIAVVHHDHGALFRISVALAGNAFDVDAIEADDPLEAASAALRFGVDAVIVAADGVAIAKPLGSWASRALFLTPPTRQGAFLARELRARGARAVTDDGCTAVLVAELLAMLPARSLA